MTPQNRSALLVTLSAAGFLMVTMGVRQSFGLFIITPTHQLLCLVEQDVGQLTPASLVISTGAGFRDLAIAANGRVDFLRSVVVMTVADVHLARGFDRGARSSNVSHGQRSPRCQ